MLIRFRSKREVAGKVVSPIFCTCIFVLFSVGPLFSQNRNLDRPYEPLVIDGSAFPSFSGDAAPLNALQLLVYRAASGTWEEIPFQIDAVEPDTAKDNLGKPNFFSPGDNLLDDDDQLVFLLADAGDRAPANRWPAEIQARSYPRYEIEITDPLDGVGKAWVYLHRSSTLNSTTPDYMTYTPGPVGSLGADVISGLGYSEGHLANGIANSIIIPQNAGGSGINFFDRWKLRLRADVLPPIIVINVNEANLVNLGVRVVDGKVRILRELHEEINIGAPIDTTGILFKFYPYSQVLSGVIKLSSELKIALLRQSFDFLPNAAGMTLFNHNGDSLRIDGAMDNPNTNVVLSPEINWAMATGSHGAFLNLFEVPAIGTTRRFYYRDNAQGGTNDGSADTGDGKSYGDNGLWIEGTAITGDFRLALTSYYLPADQPRGVGASLRDRTKNPVVVGSQVQNFDSVRPTAVRDLHIVTSTLTTVTLEWTAPSDVGSAVVSYQLAYSTTPIGSDTSSWFDTAPKATNLPAPAPAGTVQSATVQGLTTGAKYFFMLRSVDDFGNVSPFSNIATIDAVPVELISFTARAERNRVLLLWQTASETNNLGFAIERRESAGEWRQVGFVPGHGTTTTPQNYSFAEENLQPGTYHYRLKQIDTDGTFAYTDARDVVVLSPERFHLSQNYPNPFALSQSAVGTLFQYELSEAAVVKVNLCIFNVLGHEVRRFSAGWQSAGYFEIAWDGRNDRGELVPSGIYFYELTAGAQRLSRKLVVVQ